MRDCGPLPAAHGYHQAMHPDFHLPPGGHCIRNVRRDFTEWHRGRPRYLLWALDVDVAGVRRRVAVAQRRLHGLLLDGYRRQPHVTLSLCGFPCAEPRCADEFGPARVLAQLAALRAARLAPFDIAIGALGSFASAPYLAVADPGGHLDRLRVCLAAGTPSQRECADAPDPDLDADPYPYTPHVTVGLYADAWSTDAVRPRLARAAAEAPLSLRIARIGLFGYATHDIGGPLTRLADYELANGVFCWRETVVFAAGPADAIEAPPA